MAKNTKFDINKLQLPLKPGDPIFFVLNDNNTIEEDIATAVGVDEECKLMIQCDGNIYEIGNDDRVFMSEEDAKKFADDPESIPDDYGVVDCKKLDLPYYPGQIFYYCDYDGFMGRWEIIEEYYTYVAIDILGNVIVGDGESECTVIGQHVDPCFDTLRKARAYIRSQM